MTKECLKFTEEEWENQDQASICKNCTEFDTCDLLAKITTENKSKPKRTPLNHIVEGIHKLKAHYASQRPDNTYHDGYKAGYLRALSDVLEFEELRFISEQLRFEELKQMK